MAFTILLSSACQPTAEVDWGLSLISSTMTRDANGVVLDAGIDLRFSPEMREALDRGVPIHLSVTTRVSRHHRLAARLERSLRYGLEIRHLPMLGHYQLSDLQTGEQTTFPRLWMLLDALATPRRFETGMAADEWPGRDWQVQIRADVDRSRLPSPMRLPAWFSPQWRLGSGWHSWLVKADEDVVS